LYERALATDKPLPGYDESTVAALWMGLGENRLAIGDREGAARALARGQSELADAKTPHGEVVERAAALARALAED
jgi:hypothetical protein